MKIINTELLNDVTEKAKMSSRLRMNFNFHESLDAKAQRLLNAMEPGTKMPAHRHLNTRETYVLLRGRLKVLFYNDNCELVETVFLDPKAGDFGIDIPEGQWHSIEVLESGTVIFEVKDGPYSPLTEDDILCLKSENQI
jgi:cupin fold WbuC family metalloprotein